MAAKHERRALGQRARAFWRHGIRNRISKPLARLAAAVAPPLYLAYMRLVWRTSRVEPGDFREIERIAARHDGVVGLLWHEEVFSVAYAYPYLGIRPHTLASLGESGDLIARLLERAGYVVFRGGSTESRSRRRPGALAEMIEHMRRNRRVIYGLTVDGSKGPPYRLKTGGLVIARECGRPIALVRTWAKRQIRLPTWDRMAIPLPFNRIRYYLRGPYFVPPSAATPEGLERFRLELEDALINLAARSYADMGQRRPPRLRKRPPSER